MPKLKLSAEAIASLELPAHGEGGRTRQAIYYDELQPGLAVRVTSGGSRVYIVEAWPGGRTLRVKLGRCSDLTLSQARQRARVELGQISSGINPNERRRAERARGLTLAECFEAYVITRAQARRLAPRTEYDYRRILYGAFTREGARSFNGYLSPWRALPLASISADMIARRHAQLIERSGAQANYAMRLLSAVFNFAHARYRGAAIAANPVKVLSDMKAWARIPRRSTRIQLHELEAWFRAVLELQSPASNGLAHTVRDYLQFLLLTGLRRGEGARLKWADVDLKARIFTVRKTKNGLDHTLPLSDYLLELLAARPRGGSFVFAGAGPEGHLVEPKKLLQRVRDRSSVSFTLHDLRRTFATVAEGLDIPGYALKRLLNHKMANDVTAGYIVTDVERLRAPMQKITDFVLRAAKLRASADIIELPEARTA